MSFFIGNIKLEKGIMLAPMAGVTDYAFRRMCLNAGAEYTVTEMVSAKAIHYNDKKTATLARIRKEELPAAVQIFGSEPEIMAEAAARIEALDYNGCVSEAVPSAIDINMGCPVRKIVSNGEGSALMRNPSLIFDIVKAVSRAVKIPVTVKLRSGVDDAHINAVECALAAREGGASAVCIHGRNARQMYQPPVNLEIIASVKEALDIPVIGNGGIMSAADALEMKKATGCDGIMIARGAEGNPLIFSEISSLFDGREKEYAKPTAVEILAMAREQLELMCEDKGESIAVCEARKHLAWYSAGMRSGSEFRNLINYATSKNELLSLLERLSEANK